MTIDATLDPQAVRRVLDAIDAAGETLGADALVALGLPQPMVVALAHTDSAAPGAPFVTVSSLDLLEAIAGHYRLSTTREHRDARLNARSLAGRISLYLDERLTR